MAAPVSTDASNTKDDSEVGASATTVTTFQSGYSSSWFSQIGLTGAIETQSKQGAGITIGLVDTGVAPTNPEILGRISSQSSCAAVTFKCSNGYVDDNGHGTSTASIAAGQYSSKSLMSGVAPAASIVEEKVLNASGAGYDSDVANGIIKAANAGAQVINLSLTYTPTAAIINAINYATADGAVVVYAGGNSSAPLNGGASTTGLTTASLSRLVFVGSVNSKNGLSSFSNTPGTGLAYAGTSQAAYSSLWLMAPGENIVAPGIQYGATAYAYWTGTSMAAPIVAGSIALLENTWPVLQRNGTATAVLFQTASDLGTKGVDNTYGNGLLNLSAAFQPIGGLSVIETNGKSVPVSQLTSAMLVGGALGSLSSIKSLLANYTAFDSFQRNFTTNLSGLVANQSSLPSTIASSAATPVNTTRRSFGDGSSLTLGASDMSYFDGPGAGTASQFISERATGQISNPAFYMSFTTASGTTVAAGRGLPATAAFAEALWGGNAPAAYQSNQLGVSNALTGFAQGGYFASVGAPLGPRMRLAASWSSSPPPPSWNIASNQTLPRSDAAAVGLTRKVTDRLTVGVTVSALNERYGLLGGSWSCASPLSLGNQHNSVSLGASAAYNLGSGRAVMFDAIVSRTSGLANGSGLIGSMTALTARAYGVSFLQSDAFRHGDQLTISLTRPLRVTSGSATLAVTTVDDQGYPITSMKRVDLHPSGDETDAGVAYAVSLSRGLDLAGGLTYRLNAYNIAGETDVIARLSMDKRF